MGTMSRDIIEDLALIAYPHPRHGEVDPPEAFDDAAEQIAQHRAEYAENLRAMCDDTDEDPLLAELRNVAGRRDSAEAHIKALMAYGRHFTGGARPGYSWPVLAEAAGLDRKTAERRVSAEDVAAVRAAVETPVRAQQITTGRRPGTVTIDLGDADTYFVLTEALREWSHRQRIQAEDEAANDDPADTGDTRARWADVGDALLDRIEGTRSPRC